MSIGALDRLWQPLARIGTDPRGGWTRLAFTPVEAAARSWFADAAAQRGLVVETDQDSNVWAWWEPAPGVRDAAVVTGSHLDSVPNGGAYDGPLGIVSGFLAIDELRARGVVPARPVAVVAFTEEEGARFGLACLGSRLITGAVGPDRALALSDQDGTTLAQAMTSVGLDPRATGADPARLARLVAYVELHVEQGRALADIGAAVAVGTGVWPHGRWRVELAGVADHAGTTTFRDRHDPMLVLAVLVSAARARAAGCDALATVGRLHVEPGGTNVIPSQVTAWLDVRGADERRVRAVLGLVQDDVRAAGAEHGVQVGLVEESWTPSVAFTAMLVERAEAVLAGRGIHAPRLATGAGHDAAILADAGVPTVMLFVRNPTGVSHAPGETASTEDILVGVHALSALLEDLVCS
ncbi:MAG: allantoate amidohydrolase [Actinomycetes bacterium]